MLKSLTSLMLIITIADRVFTYDGTNNINVTIIEDVTIGGVLYSKYQFVLAEYISGLTYKFHLSFMWCRSKFEKLSHYKMVTANKFIDLIPKNYSTFVVTVESKTNRTAPYTLYGLVKDHQRINNSQCDSEKLSIRGEYLPGKEMNISWENQSHDSYQVWIRNRSGHTISRDIIRENWYYINDVRVIYNVSVIPHIDGYLFDRMGASIQEIHEFNGFYSFVDVSPYIGHYFVTSHRLKKTSTLQENHFFTVSSGKEFTINLEEEKRYMIKVFQMDYPWSLVAFKYFKKVSAKPISDLKITLTNSSQWNITFSQPDYHHILDYYRMELKNQLTNHAKEKLLTESSCIINGPSNQEGALYFLRVTPIRNSIALLNLASGFKMIHRTCKNGTMYLNVLGEYITSALGRCH